MKELLFTKHTMKLCKSLQQVVIVDKNSTRSKKIVDLHRCKERIKVIKHRVVFRFLPGHLRV